MADIKISALPAATTPLAGTEVLPIVQSGVTVKVAVSNLTAGRSVSATAVAITGSTSGTATIVTPAVAGTPTITLPIVTGTLATLAGTETLTNKTLTSPVIAAITNTGTLTLPTSTDTLVGRATTDTLTNKTLTSPVLDTAVTGTAVATQAQQETASATNVLVTPGRQQFHPSAAKAWAMIDTATSITASYNVASSTDNGAGNHTLTWTTAFSSANYSVMVTPQIDSALIGTVGNSAFTTTTAQIRTWNTSGASTDPNYTMVAAYGDQ